jgi:hypothetical protein
LLRRPRFFRFLDDRQYQDVARQLYDRLYALPNPLSLQTELLSIGLRV